MSRYVLLAKKVFSLILIMLLQIGVKFITGLIYQYAYAIKWAGDGIEDTEVIKEKMLDVIAGPGYIFTVNGVSVAVLILVFGLMFFTGWRRRKKASGTVVRSAAAAFISLGMAIGVVLIWRAISDIISFGDSIAWARTSANIIWKEPYLASVILCLAIGVTEELIFRGYFLKEFRGSFGIWSSVILQAFFAGVFQMSLRKGIYAFVIALVMGYLFVGIQSVWVCILTRGAVVALSLGLSVAVGFSGGYVMAVAGAVLLGMCVFLAFIYRRRKNREVSGVG